MNEFWIEKYLRRIGTRERRIFMWVFVLSFLVHAFVMTNNLANYDSVWYLYGFQDTVTLGRWFLTYAGGISSYFQTPMLIGVLSILYISITAVIVSKLLEIDNIVLGVLAGVTLSVYPTVARIFNFMYAADAYFLSMLMAALAAYLMTRQKWYNWLLGGGILGCAIGIYQSFFSVACILLLLWIIRHTLINAENIVKQLAGMVVGLLTAMGTYVIGLTYRLHGGKLSSYQGIADSTLIHSLKWYGEQFVNAFRDIIQQVFVTDVYENKGIKTAVILAWIITLILVVRYIIPLLKSKQYMCIVFAAIAIALMPMSVYCMNLLSDGVSYYSLMLSGISAVWLLPILILDAEIKRDNDRWKRVIANALLLCLCLNLWNYIVVDNISYLASSVSNDKTYALAERIIDRIEQADGYEDMECVYLYGNVSSEWYAYDVFDGKSIIGDDIIPYDQTTYGLYTRIYIRKLPLLGDNEKMIEIQNTQEFKDMPIWPQNGCVKLINDVMVVRLS